jgi:lipoprotein-anchoring transpeptidase ErfK/SrfK
VVAVVASAAVVGGTLVAWAPWASGRPGEGGTGREVVAVPSRPPAIAPQPTAAPEPTAAPQPTAAPVGPDSGWIATLHSPLSYSATPGGPAEGTLPATNPFGAAEVVAVIGRPGTAGWSQVELPIRPNGSSAWMQTSATSLTWTTYRVAVSVAAHTLTVTEGAGTVLTASAAVGASRTPTPAGSTYLWELVRPDDQAGAYGPYIFGLGMFSNAYSVFNGGDAQIGIHGNDEPSSIGQPVSHGCVRLDNALIARLAGMLPLGTPVTVS